MTNNIESLARELYKAKTKWAEDDKEASRLEELKKVIMAEIYNQMRLETSKSQKDCEMAAIAHENYRSHVESMVEARGVANKSFAHVEGIRERIKEMQRADIQNAMEIKYG